MGRRSTVSLQLLLPDVLVVRRAGVPRSSPSRSSHLRQEPRPPTHARLEDPDRASCRRGQEKGESFVLFDRVVQLKPSEDKPGVPKVIAATEERRVGRAASVVDFSFALPHFFLYFLFLCITIKVS